ncbi:hypothetical protein RQP46_003647 [Phenoliferia psychrophenolica]
MRPLVAAVAFFLVTKAFRVVTMLYYAVALPEFREAHLFAVIFLSIIWAPSLEAAAIIATFGIFAEVISRLSLGIGVTLERRKAHARRIAMGRHPCDSEMAFPLPHHVARMMPAVNIEHMIERNGALVTVVLGEGVVSVLYVATTGSIGASRTFGRSTLALIICFILNALYFDSSLSRRFVHAIRRHWATHIVWDTLTWPMATALMLASSAVRKIVSEEDTPPGMRWQFGGGLGIALLCITATGLLHRSLDPRGASRLNQTERALARAVVSAIFILIPLAQVLSDLAFLFIYASVASALIVFEIWAKIGNIEAV